MKPNRIIGAAAVATAAVGILAGCGATTTPPTSAAPAASASGTASCTVYPAGNPMAAPAAIPQQVNATLAAKVPASFKGKPLVMAVAPDQPSVNFAVGSARRGAEADLLTAAAARVGITVQYQQYNAPLSALEAGKAEGIVAFLNDTKAREAQGGIFVDYMDDTVATLVPKCNPQAVTSDKSLCGKKIAAAVGTVQLTQLQQKSAPGSFLATCAAAGSPDPTAVQTETVPAALTALMAGRADAFIIDTPIAQAAAEAYSPKLAIAYTEPVQGQPIGFLFTKLIPAESQLAPVLQASLQSMIDDGTYAKIMAAYGLKDGLITKVTVNGATR